MPRRPKNSEASALETAIESHVAGRIRLRRGLLGMSQSDLARALGITFQQVQKYERGSNRVSLGKLYRLADILDVPLTFFFDGIEGPDGPGGHRPPAGSSDGISPSPALSRRDLDILRSWRQASPAIADAIATLLRALTAEDRAQDAETGPPGAAETSQSSPRRRRGVAWDPADVKPPRGTRRT